MANHLTGPHLNTDINRGNREWYKKQPRGYDPDYIVYQNDFLSAEDLDTTNAWSVVKDSSAAVSIVADADGGEVLLSSAATTDDDGSLLQSVQENWSLSSGKQLWMECRVKLSDADDMDAFIGLSDAIATNPEGILTDDDRVGFQINDGDASILCKSEKNGTESSTDSGVDAADDTYVKLGIYWDGSSAVEFYVNRAKVATHTSNNPDDEQLNLVMFELSGSATGTKSMTVDYIQVIQER